MARVLPSQPAQLDAGVELHDQPHSLSSTYSHRLIDRSVGLGAFPHVHSVPLSVNSAAEPAGMRQRWKAARDTRPGKTGWQSKFALEIVSLHKKLGI